MHFLCTFCALSVHLKGAHLAFIMCTFSLKSGFALSSNSAHEHFLHPVGQCTLEHPRICRCRCEIKSHSESPQWPPFFQSCHTFPSQHVFYPSDDVTAFLCSELPIFFSTDILQIRSDPTQQLEAELNKE